LLSYDDFQSGPLLQQKYYALCCSNAFDFNQAKAPAMHERILNPPNRARAEPSGRHLRREGSKAICATLFTDRVP